MVESGIRADPYQDPRSLNFPRLRAPLATQAPRVMAAAEGPRGVTVKDVASHDFVIAYAAHLKRIGKIEVPKWADLVKTATHKELAPYDPDWYYIRAAAIARRVYLRAGTGVGAFKKVFGGRVHRGTRPEHFGKASGSIARHILKELESLKIVEKVPGGRGRRVTPQGQRDLDSIAGQIGEK